MASGRTAGAGRGNRTPKGRSPAAILTQPLRYSGRLFRGYAIDLATCNRCAPQDLERGTERTPNRYPRDRRSKRAGDRDAHSEPLSHCIPPTSFGRIRPSQLATGAEVPKTLPILVLGRLMCTYSRASPSDRSIPVYRGANNYVSFPKRSHAAIRVCIYFGGTPTARARRGWEHSGSQHTQMYLPDLPTGLMLAVNVSFRFTFFL